VCVSVSVCLADIRMSKAADDEKPGAEYPGDSSGTHTHTLSHTDTHTHTHTHTYICPVIIFELCDTRDLTLSVLSCVFK